MTDSALLKIEQLAVEFKTREGMVTAVENVSFELPKGKVLAIVGESGSGKSVTSYSILGLLGDNGAIRHGEIIYDGMKLHNADPQLLRDIRGREISMIFQNPRSTLNPIRTIGSQLADMLRAHAQATYGNAREKALRLLEQVKINNPLRVAGSYPFELSGGMCQRAMIALALACDPKILIADEPTTGLDVTTQKSIMDLIQILARQRHMSIILITHDLGMAARYSDLAVVMEKGRLIEKGPIKQLFTTPAAAYTRQLLAATPRVNSSLGDLQGGSDAGEIKVNYDQAPLLTVKSLRKVYLRAGQKEEQGHPAVKNVDFCIYSGECVGLVGESGCGKSTTSRIITRLENSTGGRVEFNGVDITAIPAAKFPRSPMRRDIQMVFQDPTDSLNPGMSAFDLIAEPIRRLAPVKSKPRLAERIEALCHQVKFPAAMLSRFPHQLSGGQKARVGIARAIAVSPKLLVLDEPTSALDVSVQAVVLQLLHELRMKLNLSYLFVSHDLNVVRLLCDRVLVMCNGEIVEQGTASVVMRSPCHPYTQSLVEAIPHLD